jgi:hypothetical protein
MLLKCLAPVALVGLVIWGIWSDTGGAATAVAAPAERPAGEPAPWRADALWDDGKAEFCVYEVDWARYGRSYPGRALLILVKEPWAPDLEVKADEPRPDGFDVLKLNHVRDVPTGIYTYHQMASVYFRRDTGGLQKLTAASTEACGVSTAQVVGGRLAAHSYFDGVGDRSLPYPVEALPLEGLPALLRDYVEGPVPPELAVFAPLMDSRLADLSPRRYRVSRREESVEAPAGSFPVVVLELAREGETLTYRFERTRPHRLVEFRSGDGTVYRLAKCERVEYWRLSAPGNEDWYPKEVRG